MVNFVISHEEFSLGEGEFLPNDSTQEFHPGEFCPGISSWGSVLGKTDSIQVKLSKMYKLIL